MMGKRVKQVFNRNKSWLHFCDRTGHCKCFDNINVELSDE